MSRAEPGPSVSRGEGPRLDVESLLRRRKPQILLDESVLGRMLAAEVWQ